MKQRRIALFIAVFSIFIGFVFVQDKFWAFGWGDLSVKGVAAAGLAGTNGDEAAMDYIKECNSLHPGSISAEELEFMLDQGYLSSCVDELKSLGYISAGYSSGSNTSATTPDSAPSSTPEPAAFTVEDMEDTPMWATQVVNYRDGASSDYNKLGSLDQYEQVIVNGVASTGWYRFNTVEGTVAYISNNYLTTEDPSNRELNIYNKETDQVDTYFFEDTDPEAIDEVIEDIKEEYAEKESVVEEEPEEVVEPEPIVEEPVEMENEAPAHSWQFYVSIVFAVICVIVIVVCICYVVRNKKRGRVD